MMAKASTKRQAPDEHESLLDLHVPQDPDGAVAAVTPLAWCVKPESRLAERLKTKEFVKPYLLLVVRQKFRDQFDREFDTYTYGDLEATLTPLTQGLQYLSFIRPGENEVLAFVVDVRSKSAMKQLRRDVARVNKGPCRDYSAFEDDGTYSDTRTTGYFDRPFEQVYFLDTRPDVINVVVPPEMFAPEPAAWRKRLVARVFSSSNAVDQCHFRKKFLPALAIAPFWLLAVTLAKVAYLAVCVPALAPRRLAWRKFLDPWGGSYRDRSSVA